MKVFPLILVAVAAPSVGVTSTGEVEKTTLVEAVPVVPVAAFSKLSWVPVEVTDVAPKVKGVGIVTTPVKVGEASGAKAVEEKAFVPSVPPAPMFKVELSVPARVSKLETLKDLPAVVTSPR